MIKYIVSLAVVLTASLFVSKANAAAKEQPIKIAPLAVTNSNVASSLDKPIIIIKDDGTIIIIMKDNEDTTLDASSTRSASKKLSKSEYIQTVASADAIGALAGAPMAVAASAAAAAYFDVE